MNPPPTTDETELLAWAQTASLADVRMLVARACNRTVPTDGSRDRCAVCWRKCQRDGYWPSRTDNGQSCDCQSYGR
jgi:hypothetical protein